MRIGRDDDDADDADADDEEDDNANDGADTRSDDRRDKAKKQRKMSDISKLLILELFDVANGAIEIACCRLDNRINHETSADFAQRARELKLLLK